MTLYVVKLRNKPLRIANILGVTVQRRKAEKLKASAPRPAEILTFIPQRYFADDVEDNWKQRYANHKNTT